MDNLNTHGPGSLYEMFAPAAAKALWDRFEFVYTPKHGSWLDMAEIELGILGRQCLSQRIDNIEELGRHVRAVLEAAPLPGALGSAESNVRESFEGGLLDHPHYTRPEEYRGMRVPEILLSGDHAKIEEWRRDQARRRTLERRADLIEKGSQK